MIIKWAKTRIILERPLKDRLLPAITWFILYIHKNVKLGKKKVERRVWKYPGLKTWEGVLIKNMKVSLIIIWLWCIQAKKKTVVKSLHQNQIRMFAQILFWQRKEDQLPKMCWTLVGIHHFPPSCLLQTFQPQQLCKDGLTCSTSEQAVSKKSTYSFRES